VGLLDFLKKNKSDDTTVMDAAASVDVPTEPVVEEAIPDMAPPVEQAPVEEPVVSEEPVAM
jgi:hypothetical protein